MANQKDLEINSANGGLNLNFQINQIKKGELTFALNAQLGSHDGDLISYQNEQSNELCLTFPEGYSVIGRHNIIERNLLVFFLTNQSNGKSEIGVVRNNSCIYETLINADCLNFHVNYPVLKVVHKVTNCGVEVYWTDNRNSLRFIDLENLPYKENIEGCVDNTSTEIDCNKLLIQPKFSIPSLTIHDINDSGSLTAGTYQFAIQYANAIGEGYTSFYSITNPTTIHNENVITPDFNYETGKSITIRIAEIDTTGIYEYYNLVVIRTVNNITTPELIGTFQIQRASEDIVYTGQSKTDIKLAIEDIFFKSNVYEKAGDLTAVSDIVVWSDLTTVRRIDLQHIANQIKLQWQTFKMPNKSYKDPVIASKYRGYMRDETYAFELVPIYRGGLQGDKFHIPNRVARLDELVPISNNDTIDPNVDDCNNADQPQPKWRVYNTGTVLGKSTNSNINDDCYIGPYEYGEFAYTESTSRYPCDEETWGDLANQPIRHHKFPDSTITHIHDNNRNIYPIGVKVNVDQIWSLISTSTKLTQEQKDSIIGFKITRANRAGNKSVIAKGLIHNVGLYSRRNQNYFYPNYSYNDVGKDPFISISQTDDDSGENLSSRLDGFSTPESKKRFTFHSPDTHFYQPYLGNILKLETIESGVSKGSFSLTREHAKYKFLTSGSYITAIAIGGALGALSSGLDGFGGEVLVAAYKVSLDIIEKLIPRKNFAYQYDSIGHYNQSTSIPNLGNKQRRIDIGVYLLPGMQGVGDVNAINNYQRESSVYVRTNKVLPFTHEMGGFKDESKWSLYDNDLKNEVRETPISSFYASIKKNIADQYGSIYSYESIDTGSQFSVNKQTGDQYVFGGDTFINQFGYKSKFPFFIDNRIKLPDESDIHYPELGNVGYPTYWFSTDPTEEYEDGEKRNIFKRLIGVKLNNFDDKKDKIFYQNGKIYLFSYGIPYYYCESEVNVDFRQASNVSEGDYYPRVSSDIPYDWFQEINVPIIKDNTYIYNKTFSKQNKENFFSYLPENYTNDDCITYYPNRAIFSEQQQDFTGKFRNNWLVYKPSAIFDFPLNYGKLTSVDGLDNRQVLVRFENKSLIYNALVTTNTSVGQVFLGQSIFNKNVPPLDFAETDLGYNGTQHKMLLRTEFGNVSIDSKRGQLILMQGQKANDIGKEKAGQFLTNNLDFEIKKSFPDVNIDNHFNNIGLHGVYDSKHDRVIITKLDWKPKNDNIVHRSGKFYLNDIEVSLEDPLYFYNHCFTLSFSFDINAPISFHSYRQVSYIGSANIFYSIRNGKLWKHNTAIDSYCNFNGVQYSYIIEYPFAYSLLDESVDHISDYTKVLKYEADGSFVEVDDKYFNKAILHNNQQCSGVLTLIKKPQNKLSSYTTYPRYINNTKEITYVKADNQYIYHDFCDLIVDKTRPIFIPTTSSIFKDLNESNISYKKPSFKESIIVAKDLKVRHILEDSSSHKFISQFIIAPTKYSII